MKYEEFIDFLGNNPEEFEWQEGEENEVEGVFVKNLHFDTVTHFSKKSVESNELMLLKTFTHQGRNQEHMTRVTGYFSKTAGWNKGKIAELKQRDRSIIE